MSRRKWSQQEIELWRKEHDGLGYANREDKNLIVPKAIGLGWTLNWGNPWSWVIIAAVVGMIVYSTLFRQQGTFHPLRDMFGS